MSNDQADAVEEHYELPDYVKAWGLGVRRADKLPVNYDTRIATQDIFALTPIEGTLEILVVLQKCDKCIRDKQFCDRASPTCTRCLRSSDGCAYGRMKLDGVAIAGEAG